ncbi:MAG: Organic solvent tolerance protein OstA [Flammeovirgaceae bacterium]|nr:Organic solvent tolerance protein OstA [Flammeovirgaceae bacterium]
MKLRNLVIFLFLVNPFVSFSQMESDSLLSLMEIDTLSNNEIDSIANTSEIETTINYSAKDSIFYDLKSQKIKLYGGSKIDYGEINLEAYEILVDWNDKTLDANFILDSIGKKIGKPIFSEGDQSYETDKITYNFDSRKAKIKGIVTQLDDAYMQGEDVKKNEEDELFISHAMYTTCNLEEPHFHISSSKIKVIPGKKVVSGPFHLKFGNVPTPLGFIFGMFPQPKKKVSGLIMPNYGEEKRRGFYLRDGGYYFAVNDHLDLRLTGDIYSKGSYGMTLGTNYKKRYSYSGNLRFNYNKSKLGDFENPTTSNDFSFSWSHSPDTRGKSSRFSSSVNFQTNSYNQNKNLVYSNFNESINAQFNSNISYSKTFKGSPFNLSANLRHSQNVQTKKVNLTLPDISYNMSRIYPFKNIGKLGKTALGKISISHRFNGKIELTNGSVGNSLGGLNIINSGNNFSEQIDFNMDNISSILDRSKIGGKHTIPISTSFNLLKYFTVSPSVNYNEIWYFKKLSYNYNELENGIEIDTTNSFQRAWSYSSAFALSTRIYGTVFFKKGKIKAIRHVISPEISMSFSPDFTKPKYGYYENVQINNEGDTKLLSKYENFLFGSPRIGSSASMNFYIGNNLEMKVLDKKDTINGTRKIKIFDNLAFSSSYNFLADSFRLAPIRFSTRTSFFKRLINLSISGNIDPYTFRLDSISESATGIKNVYQRRVDELAYKNNQGIGSLAYINMALGFRFSAKDFRSDDDEKESSYGTREEIDYINSNIAEYIDFNVPWSINASYNLNRRKIGFRDPSITQTLTFSGDVSISEKTKISFRSGYDFKFKMLTQTSINATRDLHCWRINFSWVPFGRFQSYNLSINAVSALLQDLKLEKRSRFFDNL